MVPELFCKNVPESLYRGVGVPYHPWLPDVYQISDTLLSQHFKAVLNLFGQIWPPIPYM